MKKTIKKTIKKHKSIKKTKHKSIIKKQTKYKSIKKIYNNTKNKTKRGGGVIQKIVHQIWFGSKVPAWRKYLFDHNKEVCKRNGYAYRLWVEDDRLGATGRKNFPSTIDYQATALEYGNSRWAQVADLARLEIIYLHGGIYLDSLFEISDLFLKTLTEISEKGHTFIGANEDPCKLECVGYKGMPYLTNSFFGAVKGSSILERLLDDDALSEIDLESEYVNRTTGPYYLRKGILEEDEEEVFLFETEQIYPFNVNASEYREIHPNTCLHTTPLTDSVMIPLKDKEGNPKNIYLEKKCLENLQKAFIEGNTKEIGTKELGTQELGTKELGTKELGTEKLREEFIKKEKGPLVVYHSGLGGTWSF